MSLHKIKKALNLPKYYKCMDIIGHVDDIYNKFLYWANIADINRDKADQLDLILKGIKSFCGLPSEAHERDVIDYISALQTVYKDNQMVKELVEKALEEDAKKIRKEEYKQFGEDLEEFEYEIIGTTPAVPGWKAIFEGGLVLDIALWATVRSGVGEFDISVSGMALDAEFGCLSLCEFDDDLYDKFVKYQEPGGK